MMCFEATKKCFVLHLKRRPTRFVKKNYVFSVNSHVYSDVKNPTLRNLFKMSQVGRNQLENQNGIIKLPPYFLYNVIEEAKDFAQSDNFFSSFARTNSTLLVDPTHAR